MKKICFAVLAFTLALPALAGTIEYNNPTTGAISAAVVADGRLRVDNSHPTKFNAILANSSATTATEIKAAPGAGLSLYVSDLHVSGSAAATVTANQQLILVYGTGTNCGTGQAVIFSCYNAALGSCVLNLSTPVKIPANNALCFLSAVTGSKSAAVSGFTAPYPHEGASHEGGGPVQRTMPAALSLRPAPATCAACQSPPQVVAILAPTVLLYVCARCHERLVGRAWIWRRLTPGGAGLAPPAAG